MKNRLILSLVAVLVALAAVPAIEAQDNQRVINVKNNLAGVTRSTTGLFWTTGQAALNYTTALIRVVPTGSPSGCSIEVRTGPTAALATKPVDDANATITCTSEVNKAVNSLDRYFNINLGTLSGGTTPTVTVYVTLTNGAGWTSNQTISGVTQSTAAGDHSSPWWIRESDGTNDRPMGDAQARAINVKPGNGTNAEKHVLDGVGTRGAGVLQTGQLGTLSAVVANTLTEVVAVTTGGAKTVIIGVWVESAVATTGQVDVKYGTDTNCGTGTTTLASLKASANNPLAPGFYPLPALVVADKATCIVTEAAGTTARLITQ